MATEESERLISYKIMKVQFLDLEEKYQKWFYDADSFIEDYFIDNDFRNSFIDNCELPDHIKMECNLIKSKFGF